MKLKVFGPYGLKPRVGWEIEKDFKEWVEKKEISTKNVNIQTTTLPDRTAIVLIFYDKRTK